MRRPLRSFALLASIALVTGACAQISADEQAMLDEAAAAVDDYNERVRGVESADTDEGEVADDFDPDDPWLEDGATPDPIRTGPRPQIDQFRCPFDREAVTTARCGKIQLPGRGVDSDYTVDLAFVRFSATGDEADYQADPVVYLHGGPGGSILDDADYWYETVVAPHIETRDVILYDQRGGGRSTTLPICHEVSDASDRFYTEEASHEALRDGFLDGLEACAEKFLERGDIDLTAFNSAANAQDLVDLMWALGVDSYNLHGSSYGTRLAQTILRDAPQGVRSVVMSGAYPVEANLMGSIPVSMESSLTAVFDGCAASPRCAEALPDPWGTLQTLVQELDRDPMPVEVATSWDETITLAFDGTDLLNGLHSLLYVGYHAATIPDLLIDHLDGDDRRIERLARDSVFDHVDTATFLLVQCADESPFTTAEQLARPIAHEFLRAVDLAPSLNGADALEICTQWDTGDTDPRENEPIVWDVPTLILAGAVDPITPPQWAEALADRLPRSRLVVLPEYSHDSDEGWCALGLIGDFVARPDVLLDTSCAADTATLTVEERAERFRRPTQLIETSYDFDHDDSFAEFEAPDWTSDWADDAHVYWRALDQLDPTALILLGVDSGYDPVEHLAFSGSIPEWDESPRGDGPPGWTRWTMETTAGTLVSYVNDDTGVEVVLATEPGEPDDLERSILQPVVASIGEQT